ncbi:hypothetical protein ACLKA7_009099 [Drosophila subpalustris]
MGPRVGGAAIAEGGRVRDETSAERPVKSKLVRINQAFKTCLATEMSSKDAMPKTGGANRGNRSLRISNGNSNSNGIDIDAAPEIVVCSFPYAILCNCGTSATSPHYPVPDLDPDPSYYLPSPLS